MHLPIAKNTISTNQTTIKTPQSLFHDPPLSMFSNRIKAAYKQPAGNSIFITVNDVDLATYRPKESISDDSENQIN